MIYLIYITKLFFSLLSRMAKKILEQAIINKLYTKSYQRVKERARARLEQEVKTDRSERLRGRKSQQRASEKCLMNRKVFLEKRLSVRHPV